MNTNPQQLMTMTTSPWYDRAMRWVQMAFVEDDPGKYDPRFWLDYFERVHADGVTLSAGGCVAFYPTDIPFHHRSAWMGSSDPFGELVEGCKERGIAVLARTDPHSIRQDAFDAHPEWAAITADGQPRRHWADPSRWVTCALGPYNFEFMTEVHKEIMERYMIEGIFSNRWAGHGLCYCESCQRNFYDAYHMELPRTDNPQDTAYRNYVIWHQQRLFDLWQLWDTAIRKINPESRYIPNGGGGALSRLDMKRVGQLADTLVADRQSRRGVIPPWASGKTAKEFRAVLGNRPIIHMFGVGIEEAYRWKDSVQSDAEINIWAADSIANGMRPWAIKFAAYLHDHRWLDVVENMFDWHHRVEKYMRDQVSLARVGLVYSQQTATFYGGPAARETVEDATLGFYHALVEARIPFDMVHDGLLDEAHLSQYKTLILPNIAALSDEQCQQLRDFVARGGGLVATYHASLFDEWGVQRENFGLADLFGVDYKGETPGPMRNSYLNLEADPASGQRHPLLDGLHRAERIINGTYRLDVAPNTSFPSAPLTFVPPYPDLPMEEVYPRVPHTDIAEVYLRDVGRGRVVYFPWNVDRIFWEVLNVDHGRLLSNAVIWATNEDPIVTVSGPGVIDLTVWRQADAMTVHLVNLTNPMMMKGPFRELLPVGAQQVYLRLPDGAKVKNVRLLKLDKVASYSLRSNILCVAVPAILDHEVVAVDLVK